jgi:tetratricopeptide (TPR) repeat protein
LDFYRTGDYDKAISDFNEAIRLNPKDGRDYYMRGWAYKPQGKDSAAQADFEKAKQLGYDNSPAPAPTVTASPSSTDRAFFYGRGLDFFRTGRLRQSDQQFQ